MTSAPRIAVIGSANTDLTTFTDVFPRPGETLFGKNFEMGFGGKGANQAVASRLCGAEVLMVAKVGDDLFGQATMDNFASFGIDTTHVQVVHGAPTGVAPIFVEPNGQNRIIVVKGANDRLTPADVDAAAADLRDVDAIILQFEIPLETIYHSHPLRARSQYPLHRQSGARHPGRAGRADRCGPIHPERERSRTAHRPAGAFGSRCGRMCRHPARQGVSAGGDHLGCAWLTGGRCRGAHARAGLSGHVHRHVGCREMPSSGVWRCFLPKESPSRKPCRARISTPRCRPRGSERRSRFRAESISRRNGRGARARDRGR